MNIFIKLTILLLSFFLLLSCSSDTSCNSNNSPLISFTVFEDENIVNLRVKNEKKLILQGIYKDGSTAILNNNEAVYKIDDTSVASVNMNGEIKALKEGNTTIKVTYPKLNSVTLDILVAKELNTSNINAAYFGNIYLQTIPEDSTVETYDEKLFAMITGKVFDDNAKPLKDVKVSIKGHKEYGTTKTDENGSFAMPIEGGRDLIVRFKKDGYMSIDRKVYITPQDWTITPDVMLLKRDEKYSVIHMNSSIPRIHSSSKVSDNRGERQAAIVFEGANRAKAIDKDGNERELNSIQIRATEFKTPESMPASLPNTTAFTYCADITVEGISDDESVVFDEPIVMYIDNFLGFNVGEIVPVGYYDKNRGEWIGSENGIVVRLLDTDNNGMVDALDADDDGQPDDLDGDGNFNDEVIGISNNAYYTAGKTYQRARITHFTSWDYNFAYVVDGDIVVPLSNNTQEYTGEEGCPYKQPTNSYITSKTQVLHDDIDIAGTDIKLHYSSEQTDGYKYIVTTSVDTSDIPSTAAGAQAIFEIAGKKYEKTLNKNQLNNIEFEWDGKDALGNQLSGFINGKLSIRYSYRTIYTIFPYIIGTGGYSDVLMSPIWGLKGSVSTGIVGSNEYRYYQMSKDIVINVKHKDKNSIINGWSIEDGLYMNLHAKGTLSNAVTQKYIEVKDGFLFMVDDEPENMLTVDKLMPNTYYALSLTFHSASLSNYGNTLDLVTFGITDNKLFSENTRTKLGRFVEFSFAKNYNNTPEPGYDLYAYYRGTIFEGTSERYLGASVTPWELKEKIRYGIDNNKPFVFPTNDSAGDMSETGSYWVFLYPTELLYQMVDNIYQDMYPDYTKITENNHYFSQLGITENNTIIFNDNLGYVYDTNTGLLKTIFDNTIKKSIRTYEHDDNLRLISITDQFDNKITISRDYQGNPTSITAPNGQITRLDINNKGDLTQITYEDNSAYIFDYNDNSLLTSKRTPEGHYSSYYYNDKGRVERQIDTNNGEWQFSKTNTNKATEYGIIKPEGDKLTYIDTREFDNTISSLIKLPSGYSYNTLFDNNKTVSTNIIDNVQTVTQTTKDPLTLNTILKSQTVKMPSGLTKSITNDITYEGDIKNLQSKTQRVTTNSKTVTIRTDYTTAEITSTSPNNIKETLTYDKTTSLPLKYQYADLQPINYEYDNKGRVTKLSQSSNQITYSYNQKGNIQTITDAKGQTTSYEYDILDRIISITYPNNIKEYYSYDKEGNVLRYITPKNTNFDFTYNPLSQRTSFKMPSSKTILYSYNKNRDLTQISYPSSKKIEYYYDKSQLSKITTSDNDEFIYKYSFHNKIDTITKNNQEKTSYMYDGELLTKIRQEGTLNQDISFTYNNDFLPNSITYLNKQDEFTYNQNNQIVKVNNIDINRDNTNGFITSIDNGVFKKEFDYDTKGYISNIKDNSYEQQILFRYENNNIKEIKEINSNIISTYMYEYDNLNRLTKVIKDNQIIEQYQYDNQGNRIKSVINNTETAASYNSDDELISYGNNQYSYNQDGQLISQQNTQGITTYNYDSFQNLKEVTLPNQTKITYIYNANNQRIAKLINNEIHEKYIWLNQITLLAVLDKDDNIKQRYIYANQRTPTAYTDKDNNIFYLSYNHLGSLKAITNQNNQIIKTIDYDSFGNIINDTNPNLNIPFGFAGGLYDHHTKLTKFGYREYDSYTGRWTSKDPIDFEGGDSNLYGYVMGDPVNFVDVEGLEVQGGVSAGINAGAIMAGGIGISAGFTSSGNIFVQAKGSVQVGGGISIGVGLVGSHTNEPLTCGFDYQKTTTVCAKFFLGVCVEKGDKSNSIEGGVGPGINAYAGTGYTGTATLVVPIIPKIYPVPASDYFNKIGGYYDIPTIYGF